MPKVTRLPIWEIPYVRELPTPEVETLQVLADLLPYESVPARDLSHHEPELRAYCVAGDEHRRLLDFEAWTAQGCRLGLLRWPERDALVARIRSRWRTAPVVAF